MGNKIEKIWCEKKTLDNDTLRYAISLQDEDAKDAGTCVIMAGIELDGEIIINQAFQGNTGSYKYALPALTYLKKIFGTERVRWNDGIMD